MLPSLIVLSIFRFSLLGLISHINAYTALLGNIRVAGEVPTKNCVAVAGLLSLTLQDHSKAEIIRFLRANASTLDNVAETLRQLHSSPIPGRFEVSTTVGNLTDTMALLTQAVLDDGRLRDGLCDIVSTNTIITFCIAVLSWAAATSLHTAVLLQDTNRVGPQQLHLLALAELLGLDAFLYGDVSSKFAAAARLAGLRTGSSLWTLPTAFDITQVEMATLASRSGSGVPLHVLVLQEDMEKAAQQHSGSSQALATALARIVLLCLNADLRKYVTRSKYCSIRSDLSFLSELATSGPVKVVIVSELPALLDKIRNLFFVDHYVGYVHFGHLHRLALQWYVSC